MRIAIVLNSAWNIYNFRLGLMRSLRDAGHEVIAIAPPDGYEDRIREEGFQYEPVTMQSTGANPLKDVLLTYRLYRIYRKIGPGIILHFTIKPNTYGTFAANWLGIPSINNVCGLGTVFLDKNTVSRIAIWIYRIAFRFPKVVFFQNEDDRKIFLDRKLVRKEITDLVPGSGIDIDKFSPATGRNRKGPFVFLVISRLLHDKGILEYVEAARKLRNDGVEARFQLLGPRASVHKRGISSGLVDDWIQNRVIEYLGTTDDVKTFINNADCVVLPSYREGTPRTLLEAASLGKPLVTTDVPGCRNVVEDNFNGYLCKLQDADDLAAKMRMMVDLSEDTLCQMGMNGRKKVVEEFDERIVIRKYLSTIDSVIKHR